MAARSLISGAAMGLAISLTTLKYNTRRYNGKMSIDEVVMNDYKDWKGKFIVYPWNNGFKINCHGGLLFRGVDDKVNDDNCDDKYKRPFILHLEITGEQYTVSIQDSFWRPRNGMVYESIGVWTIDELLSTTESFIKYFGKWNAVTNNCFSFRNKFRRCFEKFDRSKFINDDKSKYIGVDKVADGADKVVDDKSDKEEKKLPVMNDSKTITTSFGELNVGSDSSSGSQPSDSSSKFGQVQLSSEPGPKVLLSESGIESGIFDVTLLSPICSIFDVSDTLSFAPS